MQQLQEERPATRKYEGAFARRNFQKLPYDQSLPAQPIGIRKAQSRKKPTNLCAPREFLKKMCLPCLILIKSCYLSHVGVLHAQRITDFFYLNYPQMNNVGKSRFLEFQAYWYTYLVISPYRILPPPSKLNR